jgi:hypothetical protein
MISIERARNGYIVKSTSEEMTETLVIEEVDGCCEVQAFKHLVLVLQDLLGVTSSKYDEERFYAVVAPGLDNQNYKGLDFAYWGDYHKKDDDS